MMSSHTCLIIILIVHKESKPQLKYAGRSRLNHDRSYQVNLASPLQNGGRVTLPSSLIRENFMESQSSPSHVNHFSISLFTSSLTSVFFHFHYLGHFHIYCLWMLIVISVHSVFHIISFHARSQSMQLSWSWIVCACFFMLILRPQAENKCFKFKPFGCHSFMCTHTHTWTHVGLSHRVRIPIPETAMWPRIGGTD